ncbi:MAG: thermonuclease family protein [Hyphomicrobiaceae bacterium TMED74]|nr:hypothetical protein [Filomicrobium sp.]RPG35566.1 MAG: thermonuclease family protein [Hyphomicrobiaceae bacterium TMED74]
MLKHLLLFCTTLIAGAAIGATGTWHYFIIQPRDYSAFSGVPEIVNADTLDFAAVRVRLHGIDAPESKNGKCALNDREWNCFQSSIDGLRDLIVGGSIDCKWTGERANSQPVVKCEVAGDDVSWWLVRNGYAVAFLKYSRDYADAEEAARIHRLGLWADGSALPREWWLKRHAPDRSKQPKLVGD